MANIPVEQARPRFHSARIATYRERVRPLSFLRSFFPAEEHGTRDVSIEVERGTEKVAVDVVRGTEGNRNTMSKSTEKIWTPPLYHEFFDATQLDLYDRLFGDSTEISGVNLGNLINEINSKTGLLQDKIERAIELQAAQTLTTGIIELKSGDNIDFKRKAASLVDLDTLGSYWTVDTVDPAKDLENGCIFLRNVGKMGGSEVNGIFGSAALNALYNNPIFQKKSDLKNMQLSEVREPQRNAQGGTLHGRIAAGSFMVNVWSYPEVYDNESGVSTPYIDATKVILLPIAPKFKTAFAAVPRLLTSAGGIGKIKGAFVFNDYPDERKGTHEFDVKSAPLVVPVAIDQIYTFKAVATA